MVLVNPGYQDDRFYYDDAHPGYSEAGPSMPMDHHDIDDASHLDGAEGLRYRSSKQWAKEELPRDAAILLESLPSKQFGNNILYLLAIFSNIS